MLSTRRQRAEPQSRVVSVLAWEKAWEVVKASVWQVSVLVKVLLLEKELVLLSELESVKVLAMVKERDLEWVEVLL